MKIPRHRHSAFTLIELLVVIAIIAILASLAIPNIVSGLDQAKMTQTASNAQGIAKLWAQMVVSNAAIQDPMVGWPGDLVDYQGGATQGNTTGTPKISSTKDFYQRLIDYGGNVKAQELARLLVAPGIQPWVPTDNTTETLSPDRMNPFKIYQVRESDPSNTIFIATKNFVYNKDITPDSPAPYKEKGFIVVRKFGDGTVYKKQQSKSLSTLGLLPGRKDTTDNPAEGQNDYLSDT